MTAAPALYHLVDDYRVLAAMLDDEWDADNLTQAAELEAALSQTAGQLGQKVEAIAGLIREFELGQSNALAEVERLQQLADGRERKAAWLRSYLLRELGVAGLDRVQTNRFVVKLIANNPSVRVLNESAIPHEFWRHYPPKQSPPQVDKQKIAELHRATGELVPGTEIVRTQRLEIR